MDEEGGEEESVSGGRSRCWLVQDDSYNWQCASTSIRQFHTPATLTAWGDAVKGGHGPLNGSIFG